jgi:hypothetical protein
LEAVTVRFGSMSVRFPASEPRPKTWLPTTGETRGNGARSLATRMRRAMNALDVQRANDGGDKKTHDGPAAPSERSTVEESDRANAGGVELAGVPTEVGAVTIDAETGGATSA